MSILVDATALYLNAQAAAGAQVLQLFDSWVGNLGPDDYRRFVQPHMRRLFAAARSRRPVDPFRHRHRLSAGTPARRRGHVIGLDWRVDLADGLGPARAIGVAVQGNLDPGRPVRARSRRSSARPAGSSTEAAGRPGHIFNLGHGILPHTPVDHVLRLVDLVHERSRRTRKT